MKKGSAAPQKNAGKATENAAVTTALECSDAGEIKIHENVISALVRKAVMSVEGVSRLSGSQLVDIIAETVGSRRMQDRAIAIQIDDDNRAAIDVKINLKFGFKIPEVSTAVQKAVIAEVENTTGMTVTKVNVIVQELETQEEAADDDEAEAVVVPQQQ